jgi:hypothetical protein
MKYPRELIGPGVLLQRGAKGTIRTEESTTYLKRLKKLIKTLTVNKSSAAGIEMQYVTPTS